MLFLRVVITYMREIMEKLAQKPFFTVKEAKAQGVSSRMLCYYASKGALKKIARGVYCSSSYKSNGENLQWEDMAVAACNIKGGAICLVSALVYYNLTDEIMKEFWIAVDNAHSKVKFPLCRIIRMRNMETGVNTIKLAGLNVRIFDKERTIIDSFRLLDFETAVKALKIYLKGDQGQPNINKLNRYIKALRAGKVQEYITAIMT